MDFLKELISINNITYLERVSKERNLDENETKLFIQKYNKHNNRLFTVAKKYMIDELPVCVSK